MPGIRKESIGGINTNLSFEASGKVNEVLMTEAFLNSSAYSESNLLRIPKGLAPQRLNPNTGLMESMELHHHIVP
jgi:hypothetical protein